MRQPKASELRLLLASARAHPTAEHEAAIRQLLDEEVEWALFAKKALDHGLAGLVGHTLAKVAPDMVPDDIRNAFDTLIGITRTNNQAQLDELTLLVERLAAAGVETIPFKGPVLAMQAFGDLGLRGFRDLDFLIHDHDVPQAVATLGDLGYRRQGNLTENQFDLIHRLQGQEILFKKGVAPAEPHTRLISLKMALDIDYRGLWNRARHENVFGKTMTCFAPEDTMIILAVHGGKELWWDIKWACDVADFIASHPQMDWDAIVSRAKAQSCYRMLLVATALARNYLGAQVPASIAAAEANDAAVARIVGRIVERWEAEDPGGPPSNKTLSKDRLLLHDGIVRRASYVLRTWFLPGPQHIPLVALPKFLDFAYIPLGLAHDIIALPFYRVLEYLSPRFDDIRDFVAASPAALALSPVPSGARQTLKRLQQTRLRVLSEVTTDPDNAAAWRRMGDAWAGMGRYRKAIGCYERSLLLTPDHTAAWKNRSDAIAAYNKGKKPPKLSEVPDLNPEDAGSWTLRAGYLSNKKKHAEAAIACERALKIDPKNRVAARIGIYSRMHACDWSQRAEDLRQITESVAAGRPIIKPFEHRALCDSETENFALATLWAKAYPPSDKPIWRGERYAHDKIRIAYISTDIRSHVVGAAIIGCLESHDRSQFETTVISLSPGDGSDIRRRAEAAVDRFVDAHDLDDASIARMMRDQEIDIAVDLNGLTGAKRHGILALRPAPVQVNYLGYPGTMAAPFIDYIIGDPVILPEQNRNYYSEKVAYLPNAYLPWDRKHQMDGVTPSRADQGLPEKGFVFACFNNLYKLSPETFDVWMRILNQVEGSVLWLGSSVAAAKGNILRTASLHGVAAERLVFARYMERVESHLARHRLADLFLDTLPYCAHSTGSDALWAGLPLLTQMGQAFPGRVAASLLTVAGLPELITHSAEEYEARAVELARSPDQLAALREKLGRNHNSTALFDTAQFTRDLETVYKAMWQRQQAGLPPEHIAPVTGP